MGCAFRLESVALAAALLLACATGAPNEYTKSDGAPDAGVPSGDGTGNGSKGTGGKGSTGGSGGKGAGAGAGNVADGGGDGTTTGMGGGDASVAASDAGGTSGGTDAGGVDAAVPDSCADKIKGTGETGTDCGGGTCPPCDNDQGCLVPADCGSLYCASGVCGDPPLPSCTDQIKNALETDVDCGGGSCAACILGKTCDAPSDCASAACTGNKCVCAPKTMVEACGAKICGTASDGCSATVNCGSCGSTQMCNTSGTCVDIPACVAGSCPRCNLFITAGCCTAADVCGCPPLLGSGCT